MSISSNSKPPFQGNECDSETLVSLDWQNLSIRFDNDVFAADFSAWIEEDLAALEGRLSQFTTPSAGRRSQR